MHRITLLRHGESQGNVQRILQGQSDYPLTEKGILQAHDLAQAWSAACVQFDQIISSPLIRARQTAEILAQVLKLPIEYNALWKERSFGELEGMSMAEIEQLKPPVDFFSPFNPVGKTGESHLDLYLRASEGIQNLLQRPEGGYLVVTHGAILNMALYAIFGITPQSHHNSPRFHFGNTASASFIYDPDLRQWLVLQINHQANIQATEEKTIQDDRLV